MLFRWCVAHVTDTKQTRWLIWFTVWLVHLVRSPAEEARRHQQKICWHVELRGVTVGAGYQRGPVCWPLTHGDRHEGKWAQAFIYPQAHNVFTSTFSYLSDAPHRTSHHQNILKVFFFLDLDVYSSFVSCLPLVAQVALEGLRPTIPPGISPHICKLMRLCMNEDPAKRPKFDMIVPILEKMQDKWMPSQQFVHSSYYAFFFFLNHRTTCYPHFIHVSAKPLYIMSETTSATQFKQEVLYCFYCVI